MKSIFKSKTAAFGFITAVAGALSFFLPKVGEFVSTNSEGILIALGFVSFALRLATSEKVSLFPAAE
jgi:hypothetical protein